MSGYRRFIAYVYEYESGKKGESRGFIKVEAKNGICCMSFRLTGLYGREAVPAKVYGYIRENGQCRSLILGDCNLAGMRAEFELEMPEEHVGESPYALEDLCGLLLRADSGELYASIWEEQPVNLQDIPLPNVQPLEIKKEEKEEMQAAETEEQREEEQEAAEEGVPEQKRPIPEMEELPEADAAEPKTEEPEVFEALFGEETEMPSFCDNGITQCRKISPGDLEILSRRDRGLLSNRFLRHGFSRYGHLLLGKREEDGRYILGVPGIYESQEALMAGMFGFPYFKETGGGNGHSRYFGYWYRIIDKPQGME